MTLRNFAARVARPSLATVSAVAMTAGLIGVTDAGAAKKKASTIPTVADPTDLTQEPVVTGDKAAPPKFDEIKDLVVGTGTTVTGSSTVTVKYVGVNYTNGQPFTTGTWKNGKAAQFSLHTVVVGFAYGLIGMKVGGRREIVIPAAYAYGKTGGGPIKANETLVFVVDLVSVS